VFLLIMQNDNEENDIEDDDDYVFDSCIDWEEEDDDDEEIPELLLILGHTALHTVSTPRVWNWEAGVELVRQHPEQARFARHKLYPDNPCTCLAYACRSGSPEAVLFLHAVRDICLDHFLIRQKHDDFVPIDGEGILNYSMPVIRMLLEIHIQTDFETKNGPKLTESNFNPLTALCSCYSGYIKETHREITSGEWTPTDLSNLEDDVGDDFWEKVTLVTKAFYHRSIEDVLPNGKVWRIMHASAGIDFFPPSLLRLLTAAFPDDVTEEDEDGNLPIHVAALGDFPSIHMTRPITEDYSEDYSEDFVANSGTPELTIAILLEANPASARYRNRQGKFPLQLAIESGRDWHDGIGALADAFLAAIGDRDKETGLDLFLLAAADDRSLTIIYNLFRAKPF
jgi:ankyrin repeat protein